METKAKKKWKTPHTFVILVVIILIAAAATYIVPAGEFTRFKDAATGKTLVEAGSYHRIASSPLNPLNFELFLLVWIFFFRKYAYKTSEKYKFIGTSGRRARRQTIEPDDRPSNQMRGGRASRPQTFNTFVKNLLNN